MLAVFINVLEVAELGLLPKTIGVSNFFVHLLNHIVHTLNLRCSSKTERIAVAGVRGQLGFGPRGQGGGG